MTVSVTKETRPVYVVRFTNDEGEPVQIGYVSRHEAYICAAERIVEAKYGFFWLINCCGDGTEPTETVARLARWLEWRDSRDGGR